MSTPPGQDQLNWWLERGGVPVTVNNGGYGAAQLMTGIGVITFINCVNTNVSTLASFVLHDGTDATGPVLAYLVVPAGSTVNFSPGDTGIYFGTGLYVQDNSGSARVSVTYVPLALPLK